MESLTLSNNNISDKDYSEILAAADSDYLRELILCNNYLGHLAFTQIQTMLIKSSTSLVQLKLNDIRLSPLLLNSFAQSLSKNTTL